MYWNNKKTVDQDSVVQLLNVFIQHVSAIYLFFFVGLKLGISH